MQPLAHLRAAMIHLHGAVAIDQHERAGLIVSGVSEADPEFHGGYRKPPFARKMRGIPRGHGSFAGFKVRAIFQVLPDREQPVIADLLAVVRRVGLSGAVVKIALAHGPRRQAQSPRDAIDDFLNHQHTLRPTKPAERRLRSKMRPCDLSAHFEVWDVVGVIEVKHRPVRDRQREIERPAAIGNQRAMQRLQAALGRVADFKSREKRMSFSGQLHVQIAIQLYAHRLTDFPRCEGYEGRPGVALRFLAAKATAHTRCLHHHPIPRQAEHRRNDCLDLTRMLGGRGHTHVSFAVALGPGRVRLEVKVLLSSDLKLTAETVRARF